MARTDPRLQVNVPQFVHDDLARLQREVAEGWDLDTPSNPRVVGALIHTATAETLVEALRAYRRAETAFRSDQAVGNGG
jgi:hypothetical protein